MSILRVVPFETKITDDVDSVEEPSLDGDRPGKKQSLDSSSPFTLEKLLPTDQRHPAIQMLIITRAEWIEQNITASSLITFSCLLVNLIELYISVLLVTEGRARDILRKWNVLKRGGFGDRLVIFRFLMLSILVFLRYEDFSIVVRCLLFRTCGLRKSNGHIVFSFLHFLTTFADLIAILAVSIASIVALSEIPDDSVIDILQAAMGLLVFGALRRLILPVMIECLHTLTLSQHDEENLANRIRTFTRYYLLSTEEIDALQNYRLRRSILVLISMLLFLLAGGFLLYEMYCPAYFNSCLHRIPL